PMSTMLTGDDIAELLRDSRAAALAYSPQYESTATAAADQAPELRIRLATSTLDEMVRQADPSDRVYSTTADSPGFWLYTSGTTGTPKAAMHRHGSVRVVCETYGSQVLGITPDDRTLSAAKAFFAYGLGNSVFFPLSVGAAVILEPAPSRPDGLVARAQAYGA